MTCLILSSTTNGVLMSIPILFQIYLTLLVHEERMPSFPQIDITQAYFLSVMFYLMFLQRAGWITRALIYIKGLRIKHLGERSTPHSLPPFPHPSTGKSPKALAGEVMEIVALSPPFSSAKVVSTKALSHCGKVLVISQTSVRIEPALFSSCARRYW